VRPLNPANGFAPPPPPPPPPPAPLDAANVAAALFLRFGRIILRPAMAEASALRKPPGPASSSSPPNAAYSSLLYTMLSASYYFAST
jgi:hypothetical protein